MYLLKGFNKMSIVNINREEILSEIFVDILSYILTIILYFKWMKMSDPFKMGIFENVNKIIIQLHPKLIKIWSWNCMQESQVRRQAISVHDTV